MIAVRDAIDRASKHPWLWIFVLLLMATLLVFVALHGVEHALEGGEVLLCIAIISVAIVLAGRDLIQPLRLTPRAGRDPPGRIARSVPLGRPSFHSQPLRL